MAEKKIGEVTHYFSKIGVAVFKLDGDLKKGDQVHIKGGKSDFEQAISSMQIDGEDIESAKPGDDIGVKVEEKVREGDAVFKVE